MESVVNTAIPTALLVLSVISSCLLGSLVLARNPQKRTHRLFAILSLNLGLWAGGVLAIIHLRNEALLQIALRGTFAVACFLPATFYHFVIHFPYQRFEGKRAVLATLYAGALVLALASASPWYIDDLQIFPHAPPAVGYGPVFFANFLLISASLAFSTANCVSKMRRATGIQRRQIEHVTLSFLGVTVFGTLTNMLAPALDIKGMELYGPCFVMIMVAGLSYSMTRYHLLDIPSILSRTTVYVVTTGFVIATFLGSVALTQWLLQNVGPVDNILTTIVAALVVVLFLQPLKERVQLLVNRTVLHRQYSARSLIARISQTASQTVQLDELLSRVARDIENTIGVERVRILLVDEDDKGCLVTEYSTIPEERHERDINQTFVLDYLERDSAPILLEELLHGWVSRTNAELATHLADMEAYLLAPLKTTSGIVGVIALSQKISRDIYERDDASVFATVAGPLATAIENARLYRELEALNLHLERIMSSMRGGVVAVDAKAAITTINEEARDMLGLARPGDGLDDLGTEVADLLRQTLDTGRGIGDIETVLRSPAGEHVPVVMSSSCLRLANRKTTGAMVLMYNMTQIKRLEQNVQRADRLSSIGTMAAGMAHEIKNPLQSIKTFTQLLPHRFDDVDFRKTFSEVVPPEVQRIDTIVSRLLDFARPKPVNFAPRDLHAILKEVLALVANQTRKAGIKVRTNFPEEMQELTADDQQLHQVFLNLMLNAIDALRERDDRRIEIGIEYGHSRLTQAGRPTRYEIPCVRVSIEDSGCGIERHHLDQLFTPFFTTKAHGSGLGLAVVHGIVTEHGGAIDVTSEVGRGTTIVVTFPLEPKRERIERVRT